jgi:ankyrin repeat protein
MVEIRNRFRWVFCQLETLRHCLPPSVRRTLNELPLSLDETYARVLREIKRPNRDHARRLLQCLVVAIRPLVVKQLAEILAVDFDDAEGIPKLKPEWRWGDEEQAILSSCSSLILTVKTRHSWLVQFSHFSVKEYLISERLATSSGDISRYHIGLGPAHTIMAQACMGILLRPDDRVEEDGVGNRSPLARYAARHWATHAQSEMASSFVRKAMEYLFDPNEPYFAAWLQLYDTDAGRKEPFVKFSVTMTPSVIPLYYAALCGIQDLVEHLVTKYPHHVNTIGGKYGTPLVAALAGRHFQIARHFLHNGANVDIRGELGPTPLYLAAWYGDLEMVQLLLDYKADAKTRTLNNYTPIHVVSQGSQFLNVPNHSSQILVDIARLLLEHGADINAQANNGSTPLHMAAEWGQVKVVRVLLEHSANVGAEDNKGATPLHASSDGPRKRSLVTNYEKPEVVRMLLEHGADVGAKDNKGRTPLHAAAEAGLVEVVRVLLEHGANVGAEDNERKIPSQIASVEGNGEITKLLSEHGARGVVA